MRNLISTATLLTLGCLLAVAAPPDDRRPERRTDRPRGDRPSARDLVQNLQTDLKLTDAQRPEFERMANEYLKSLESLRQQSGGDGERLRDQIQTARRSGDTALAEELQQQAREAFRQGAEMRKNFLDGVETILTDDQKKVLATYRITRDRRAGGERGRGAGREGWDDWVNGLPGALQLTPEQRTRFDEIVAEQRQTLDENRTQIRPLVEEMRQAREDGDQDRVRELRDQIEQARAKTGGVDGFVRALETILTPEQRQKLAELPRPGADRAGPADPRRVLTAVEELDLTQAQKNKVRDITRDFRRNSGRLSQDPDERKAQADALIAQLKAVLTAEQSEKLDQLVASAQRRGPRPPREGREPIDETIDPVP